MKTTKGPSRVASPVAHSAAEQMHLTDYFRVLYKWRWVAIPAFLIVFVAGAMNTLRQTPIYEGRVQMLMSPDSPNPGKIEQMFQGGDNFYYDDFYQTQYRILQSRSLAKQTIDAMNLWNAPRLGNGPAPQGSLSVTGLIWTAVGTGIDLAKKPFASAAPPAPSTPAEPKGNESAAQSNRIDEFLAGLSINPIRNSRMVEIRYDSTDPQFAAAAANALSKAYIAQNLDQKFSSSKDAADWLGGRLAEQRRAVEASEAALQTFKEKNGANSITDTGSSNIIVQRLTDLNAALTKAKTDRINKEALYNQVKAADGSAVLDSLPAVQANDYIQKLKTDLADLQRQQAQLAQRYDERHPEMIKMHSAVQSADAKLRNEMSKVVDGVKSNYQAAVAQERDLQAALDAQKNEALGLNRRGIEYGVLQREAESNRQIYESLLQRTKESDISRDMRSTNVRVVDAAEVPRGPISPNVQRDLSLSFVASLVLSVGLAFFVNYLDSRLKTPQDLKVHLGVPFLGMIPAVTRNKEDRSPLLDGDVPANFAEAFKTVRTNVLF